MKRTRRIEGLAATLPDINSTSRVNRAADWARLSMALLLPLSMPAHSQRAAVEAEHGIVASANRVASEIGVGVMRRGGNAVDAAVATAFALAVVYPRAGNLAGGGFALIRLSDGRSVAVDFRETAPADSGPNTFLDQDHHVIANQSTVGYRASGVPGTVAGLALAESKYGSGRLSWRELIEPARVLAERGFAVTAALARDMETGASLLEQFPESKRIFLRDGRRYRTGEVFRQPELAATLSRLQAHGPREFYAGRTAALIVDAMHRNGGLVSAADLSQYRALEREPLHGRYRGFDVLTMPPPSSGGVALLQMLEMLEPYDVSALGVNSAAKIHLFAEAMRRAFRDRAQFLGDPDFVTVPVAALLDRAYVQRSMAGFNPEHETANAALVAANPPAGEATDTTHVSIVDSAGNAVALTYTLNGLWGSGVTVPGTGMLLNNEMDDFALQPGSKNMYGLVQGEANAIAPRKRPLSSMTPTILSHEGTAFLVTGSPGGPTIINTVLLVLTNVVDHALSVTQAVDAPRFHHQWEPDRLDCEPLLTSEDSLEILRHEGYTLAARTLYPNAPPSSSHTWGDAETILVDPRTHRRLGANDLRSPDSAAVGW